MSFVINVRAPLMPNEENAMSNDERTQNQPNPNNDAKTSPGQQSDDEKSRRDKGQDNGSQDPSQK